MGDNRKPLAAFPNGQSSRLSMAPQRKSLAPTANPRQSMAPAAPRASLMPDRKSSVGSVYSRQSSIGGRKSIGSTRGGGTSKQDTRNVTDKGVMKQYINNIVEYLAEQSYTKQLAPKTLYAPSSKDFVYILEFLYQQFDPTFKIGKPEEDVVFIFKILKYPFPISKRNIAGSIGAPHTWPPFLAALNWMVELLRAQSLASSDGPLDGDGWVSDAPDDKQFFEFICKSYPPWLDGSDDMPSLDDELEQNFENRNKINRIEIDNLHTVQAEVNKEMEKILNDGNRIEAASKKKATLEADIQKFALLCDKLLSANQEAKSRLNDCNKEVDAREAELAGTAHDKARLQGVIAAQEQQSIDVAKITSKRATLNEHLETATGTKERMDAANWEDEMKLARKMDDIDKLLQQYLQIASRLQLVGADTKNANGVNFQISFDRHSVSAENSISHEVKHTIKPACKNLLIDISDKIRAVQAELLMEKDEEKQLQENIQDKQEDLRALEVKLKKLETLLQKEKEKAADDLKHIESAIEKITQETVNMREAAKTRATKSSKSVETAKLEQIEQTRRIEEETQTRRTAIVYMVEVLAKHKEWMKQHFAELHQHLQSDYANSAKQFDSAMEKLRSLK